MENEVEIRKTHNTHILSGSSEDDEDYLNKSNADLFLPEPNEEGDFNIHKNNKINIKDLFKNITEREDNKIIYLDENDIDKEEIKENEEILKYFKSKNNKKGNKKNITGNLKDLLIKKTLMQEMKKKYKNSKYITAKYKDYLHTGDKLLNNKKSNDLKKRNKLNDLYKEIQKNIENDENLLRRLELKRDISSQNHHQIKNKSKSKNKSDISADRINNIKNNARNLNSNNNQKKYFRYDNSKNLEENLLKNGFFSGKNKKNEDNEKENNDDEYNDKIREVMKKYQNNGKIIEKKP